MKWINRLLVWPLFVIGLLATVTAVALLVLVSLPEGILTRQPSPAAEVHTFDSLACRYSAEIPTDIWRYESTPKNTYRRRRPFFSTPVLLHFDARFSGKDDDLFDRNSCMRLDLGTDKTAEGAEIRYERVQCPAQTSTEKFGSLTHRHRIYGTIRSRGSVFGAGLYADSEELVETYQSELRQILKTVKAPYCLEGPADQQAANPSVTEAPPVRPPDPIPDTPFHHEPLQEPPLDDANSEDETPAPQAADTEDDQ